MNTPTYTPEVQRQFGPYPVKAQPVLREPVNRAERRQCMRHTGAFRVSYSRLLPLYLQLVEVQRREAEAKAKHERLVAALKATIAMTGIVGQSFKDAAAAAQAGRWNDPILRGLAAA